jgi:hypothetical protein
VLAFFFEASLRFKFESFDICYYSHSPHSKNSHFCSQVVVDVWAARMVCGKCCSHGFVRTIFNVQDGFHTLNCAAQEGQVDCLRALLEAGAFIEAKNRVRDKIFVFDFSLLSLV